MADLNDRSRGQMILLAAFVLAVTFVALAMVVNSAIFTENLASRGETAGSDDALQMRAMVETNAGYVLDSANRFNYSSLDSTVERGVRNTSVQTEQQRATRGALVNVTYVASESGLRIANNSSATTTFESADPAYPFDYKIVKDVERPSVADPRATPNGTRAFRINASELPDSNATAFVVVANDTDENGNENTWRANLYEDTGTGEVKVTTIKKVVGEPAVTETCSVAGAGPFTHVDLTDGTINSTHCEALGVRGSDGENFQFAAGAGDEYDIEFRNAGTVEGNFSMIVNEGATASATNVSASPSDPAPYSTSAFYSITVEYTYSTADLRYATEIRVAPGEPDA